MYTGWISGLAVMVLAVLIALPRAYGQTTHADAKAQVEARDKRKHDKLKTEGVPTVAGAVAGGVVGGPPGAFTGAKIGHGVGAGFHAIKKHHDIKKVEKHGRPSNRAARRAEARQRSHARGKRRR